MKVEYSRSAIGITPDMSIPATDFLKAFDSEEEYNYLRFAVDGFALTHGFENNLKDRDYRAAKGWVAKGSSVLFVAKELSFSSFKSIRWCEIYVIANGKITSVITSEDGEHFDVNPNRKNLPTAKKETDR